MMRAIEGLSIVAASAAIAMFVCQTDEAVHEFIYAMDEAPWIALLVATAGIAIALWEGEGRPYDRAKVVRRLGGQKNPAV